MDSEDLEIRLVARIEAGKSALKIVQERDL